jgi:hypothetical protein
MAVIISTTEEDEARDIAGILGAHFSWPYKIYVLDREFRPVPGAKDPRLHPARVWMRQLLASSAQGHTARQLRYRLADAGLSVARQTVQDWLVRDEQAGLITRSGNGWVRRQP